MQAIPLTLSAANSFVLQHHRHNDPVVGHRFSIGVMDGSDLIGVAIVGRPLARRLNNGFTAEVLRCCVLDDTPKGSCSFLYARCWKAWKAMGGVKIITYTLASETGASLRGAGFIRVASVRPGSWNRNKRERVSKPICALEKYRWEISCGKPAMVREYLNLGEVVSDRQLELF